MVWISYGIGIVSIFFLLIGFILVVGKQSQTSSISVYYFLSMIVAVMGWIISNIFVVYFSQRTAESNALFCSRFATIISMVGMVAAILFVGTLSPKYLKISTTVVIAIAFALFGGVVGLTISGDYTVNLLPVQGSNYDFYIAQTSITWIIFDAGLALFAGIVFLAYLYRQRNHVEKKYRRVINIMIAGVHIAFLLTPILFAIRKIIYAISGKIFMLHMEWISVAVGAFIISISLYLGGIEAFFYSTEVFSIYIYDKKGASLYAASDKKKLTVKGHVVLSVTAAFSEFAGELIGKEVYPKEINLGGYTLMIETQADYVCFLSSIYPTTYLRQGMKNILAEITQEIKEDEISACVEKYLAFKPKITI